MGLNLSLETKNATLLRVCTDLFGGFGPGDPKRAPDLQFSLRISHGASAATLPTFKFGDEWACAWAGGEQVIYADLTTGTVKGCFPQKLLRCEAVLRHQYLQFAFAVLLTARGFAGIHATGLERNGRTVLIRGPRGAGKSVLACAAVERGFRILADSTLWIGPEGDWWGIPWWLCLRRSSASLFPRLTLDSAAVVTEDNNGEAKLEIPVGKIRSSSCVPHAPAGIVLFLEQNLLGDSWLKRLGKEESLALWPTGESGRETLAPTYRKSIEGILEEGSHRLYFGRNLDQAVNLLDNFMQAGG